MWAHLFWASAALIRLVLATVNCEEPAGAVAIGWYSWPRRFRFWLPRLLMLAVRPAWGWRVHQSVSFQLIRKNGHEEMRTMEYLWQYVEHLSQ